MIRLCIKDVQSKTERNKNMEGKQLQINDYFYLHTTFLHELLKKQECLCESERERECVCG